MRERGAQPLFFDIDVFEVELGTVNLLASEKGRVARFLDLDLLQHLAHDHLDVLVVNAHTLQSVYLLNLVNQIARQLLDPDVLTLGYQILDRLLILFGRGDDNASLGLIVFAEFDAALTLADNRKILWLARFEQFGDAWQTASDVACLRRFARDPCEDIPRLHVRPVVNRKNGVYRHEVTRLKSVGERQYFAIFVSQRDPRPQIATAWLLSPVNHDF